MYKIQAALCSSRLEGSQDEIFAPAPGLVPSTTRVASGHAVATLLRCL